MLLARGTVAQFTLDGVAERLGVTKPAIYHYFASREALISAAMTNGFVAHGHALLEAARAAPDGPDVLCAVTSAFVAHYRDRLEEFRLDFAWPQIHGDPDAVRKVILPLMNELVAEVVRKLRRGRSKMTPAKARRLCMLAWTAGVGLVSALSITEANGTSLAYPVDAYLAELVDLFV